VYWKSGLKERRREKMDDDMSMATTFSSWSDYKTKILFSMWMVDTWVEYLISCVVVAFLVIFYHANRYLLYMVEEKMNGGGRVRPRKVLSDGASAAPAIRNGGQYQSMDSEENCCKDDRTSSSSSLLQNNRNDSVSKNTDDAMTDGMYLLLRVSHALISGGNYGLSLLLMMISMTFVPGIFLSLIIGYVLGDMIFYVKIKELTYEECH
jgi:hypothetical protein